MAAKRKAQEAADIVATTRERERERVLKQYGGKPRRQVPRLPGTAIYKAPEQGAEPVLTDYRPQW